MGHFRTRIGVLSGRDTEQSDIRRPVCEYADIKYGDVQRRKVAAEDAGVSIEKDRDKEGACQHSDGIAAVTGNRVMHRHKLLKGKVEQHGKKQKFHMFPYGFIDRGKKTHI